MTKPLRIHGLFLLVSALLLASVPSLEAGGRAYGAGTLTIKEVKTQKDDTLSITFSAMAETMYYCPGVNAKVTVEGLELTFVRSHFKKKPKVDYPAKAEQEGAVANKAGGGKVVTVPTKHGPVYLRDGKKVVKLHPKGDTK